MNREQLIQQIRTKQSFLCVGLDADVHKIPEKYLHLDDPVLAFNKAIIDATADLAVAYKPNLAFYEALGPKGWETLAKTVAYIPDNIFTIADAKRGDIGNTSNLYAEAFFKGLGFHSITLSPYMGADSIKPYLAYSDKWVIVLAATSNPGAEDFQLLQVNASTTLYEQVLQSVSEYGNEHQTMFVLGATRPDVLQRARAIVPKHFFLVPGVGAQGGSLSDVYHAAATPDVGLLVNASRSIIYPDLNGMLHKDAVHAAAKKIQEEMAFLLSSSFG